jgi:hypothetical protein
VGAEYVGYIGRRLSIHLQLSPPISRTSKETERKTIMKENKSSGGEDDELHRGV